MKPQDSVRPGKERKRDRHARWAGKEGEIKVQAAERRMAPSSLAEVP